MQRIPYSPITQRFIDAHQPVADWLGEQFGLVDPVIWWYKPNWSLGLLHLDEDPPAATALYAFGTPDPDAGGLEITDKDMAALSGMLIHTMDTRRALEEATSNRLSAEEERVAEQAEANEIGRYLIGEGPVRVAVPRSV